MTQTLKQGDRGALVSLLQLGLTRAGQTPGALDGIFGAQAAGLSEQAVQALSDDDVRLVTESGSGYVVRFRLLELWDALVQRLS